MPNWQTLASEIAEYFREKYFSPDLVDLKNFDGVAIGQSLPYLCLCVCAGIFFAALISYYNGAFLGRVVRELYNTASFREEDAKTLEELGCNHPLIRRNLRSGSVLSKYVKPATPIQTDEDIKTAKFYLAEETKFIADKRYKAFRGGKRMLILLFVLCVAAYFFLLYYLPDAVRLADNAINMIQNG